MENNILSNKNLIDIVKKNTHLYCRTLRAYYPETYTFIETHYNGKNISEKIYKHLFGERYCLNCQKLLGGRGFRGVLKGYSHFCSDTCASKHPYRLQQINNSNLKKYGVKWNGQIKEVKEKIKRNNIKKYGVPHVLQVKSIIAKKNNTYLQKYNDVNYTNRDKCKRTTLIKYGVEHVSQDPDIHAKQQKSFRPKIFVFPSGKQYNVQGYEPYIIRDLLKQYHETNIEVCRKNMPELWYIREDGTRHRYFPDIYIKSENLIIEVKSTWTNKIDRNLDLKEKCVLDNGYKFQKFIVNRKGETV